MQISHGLQPLPAAQVGMHHAALNGPGPDDAHLDDEVFEAGRLQPREHLSLGAALHLECADGVARGQEAIDRGVVQGQAGQVRTQVCCVRGRPAVLRNQRAGLADCVERPQAKQIDLDESCILDAVFVPLRDDDPFFCGALQRHDFHQGLCGDQHPAGMHGEVPRRADQLRGQLQHQRPSTKGRRKKQEGRWIFLFPSFLFPFSFFHQFCDVRLVLARPLGDPVHVLGFETQRARHIAHRTAPLIGVDVAHHGRMFGAVTLIDVSHHLIPPVGLEVQIDVRHVVMRLRVTGRSSHAFSVLTRIAQKSFEEKVVFQRIYWCYV